MESAFGVLARGLRKESKAGGTLNANTIFNRIFEYSEIQDWIIDTIQTRIYETGKVANNDTLRTLAAIETGQSYYSYYTAKDKQKRGLRYKNVTLKDTGEFYKSWDIEVRKTFYKLNANFKKGSEYISDNFGYSKPEFENLVLSLSDSDNTILSQKLISPEMLSVIYLELTNIIKKI